MVIVKYFCIITFGFFIIILITFWGFKNNFPGASLARVIELNLTKKTGIPIEIKDLRLDWGELSTAEISIYTPKWFPEENKNKLLVFEEIESPFSTFFTNSEITINAQSHGGKIKFSTEAFSQKNLEIVVEKVKLEQLPLMDLNPYASFRGNLSFSGNITNFRDLQKKMANTPYGNFRGIIENSDIIFSRDLNILELQFPELNFSKIIFDIQIGELIKINNIKISGSIQGEIEGTIRLNKNILSRSLIDIDFKIIPSSKIMEKIQILSPIINPLKCGETINFNVKGSIERIKFPTGKPC